MTQITTTSSSGPRAKVATKPACLVDRPSTEESSGRRTATLGHGWISRSLSYGTVPVKFPTLNGKLGSVSLQSKSVAHPAASSTTTATRLASVSWSKAHRLWTSTRSTSNVTASALSGTNELRTARSHTPAARAATVPTVERSTIARVSSAEQVSVVWSGGPSLSYHSPSRRWADGGGSTRLDGQDPSVSATTGLSEVETLVGWALSPACLSSLLVSPKKPGHGLRGKCRSLMACSRAERLIGNCRSTKMVSYWPGRIWR